MLTPTLLAPVVTPPPKSGYLRHFSGAFPSSFIGVTLPQLSSIKCQTFPHIFPFFLPHSHILIPLKQSNTPNFCYSASLDPSDYFTSAAGTHNQPTAKNPDLYPRGSPVSVSCRSPSSPATPSLRLHHRSWQRRATTPAAQSPDLQDKSTTSFMLDKYETVYIQTDSHHS